MIEVERKFRINDTQVTAIETDLRETYGATDYVRQVDEVYLRGIDSFAEFEQGMPVARLRTVDGQTEFAYKRRLNDAGDMLEHEMSIGSAEGMRLILTDMDFRPVTIVDKMRLEAKSKEMSRMIDIVKGLAGAFLEMEVIVADESEIAQAEARIMKAAAEYGLTNDDLETHKYDKLVAMAAQRGV
jgi:predicted adenylyl cyclase CyaB